MASDTPAAGGATRKGGRPSQRRHSGGTAEAQPAQLSRGGGARTSWAPWGGAPTPAAHGERTRRLLLAGPRGSARAYLEGQVQEERLGFHAARDLCQEAQRVVSHEVARIASVRLEVGLLHAMPVVGAIDHVRVVVGRTAQHARGVIETSRCWKVFLLEHPHVLQGHKPKAVLAPQQQTGWQAGGWTVATVGSGRTHLPNAAVTQPPAHPHTRVIHGPLSISQQGSLALAGLTGL